MTRNALRVLGIFAHPDDAEIWAGGTLLAHRLLGDSTAICVLTHGDDPRADEARRGADLLQARLIHLAFRDRELPVAQGTVEAVAAVLAEERPHLLITHWRDDSHPDHRTVWQIATAAVMLAEVENELRALVSCDTYNGAGLSGHFQPDYAVDVSGIWEEKLAAIHAHASQGPDYYCRMIERQCAMHGSAGGVAFAEGFVHVPYLGRGRSARPSLWDLV
jgi:LmbE family N-acetylglucosaminyl deacetylase